MRTLRKNKQKLFFSTYSKGEPIYQKDASGNIIQDTFTDNDGRIYTYPKEIGHTSPGYTLPVELWGNISMTASSGDAEAREFGIDISQYSATLVCDKNAYELDETSIVWFQNEVGYLDPAKTQVAPNTADYTIAKIIKSLNYTKYLLQRTVNNG